MHSRVPLLIADPRQEELVVVLALDRSYFLLPPVALGPLPFEELVRYSLWAEAVGEGKPYQVIQYLVTDNPHHFKRLPRGD